MRFVLAIASCLLAGSAAADLYRWIDPESGSVKFSSYPPPWYGDPETERRSPKVERIPEMKPATAAEPKAPPGSELEALEARRKRMLQQLSALPGRSDFNRAGAGIKQQLEAYQTLAAELDRVDPKGAVARRAETLPLIERLVEGLRAQFGAKPPAPPPGNR